VMHPWPFIVVSRVEWLVYRGWLLGGGSASLVSDVRSVSEVPVSISPSLSVSMSWYVRLRSPSLLLNE